MTGTIELASVLYRNEDLLIQPIDDDVVMADMKSGTYFGLTGSAKAVWDMLDTPVSVDALCSGLGEHFDVVRSECERDVLAFLREMVDAGLVRVAE